MPGSKGKSLSNPGIKSLRYLIILHCLDLRSGLLSFLLYVLAIQLTGNLLHECHANTIGSQNPTLH